MLAWSLVLALTAGIFQEAPLDGGVKKIDLLLREEEVAFIFLSLSNGEAMLIKNAEGKNILVNTGGPSTAKELRGWLNKFRIRSIDTILITNRDEEYIANLPWLKEFYRVNNIIAATKYPFQASNEEIKAATWKEGERYELTPGLITEVLSEYRDTLSLSFKYGDFRLLYMASGEKIVERHLKTIPLKDVNILKVANFAQGNLSTSFLKHIDPQAAIIFQKKGAIPNEQLLEELYHLWIETYQMGKVSMVAVKCDKEHYEIITF